MNVGMSIRHAHGNVYWYSDTSILHGTVCRVTDDIIVSIQHVERVCIYLTQCLDTMLLGRSPC